MSQPIHVLELRSVRGTGGGPEKTILLGAAQADPRRFAVTVCYLRDRRDRVFTIDRRARELGINYVEVEERHSFDPRVWPALKRLVQERGIDIVHAHDYKTDLLAYLLARSQGVIPMATVHNWAGVSWRERIYYWFDRRLLTRFPRLVAVSAKVRQQLEQAGTPPGRIQLIPNGIDTTVYRRDPGRVAAARSSLGLAPNDVVLGSVGRIEGEKRYDLLVETLARMRQERPRLRLLVAGEGSLRPRLEDKAARLGLGDSCRFLGHCPDVLSLYHALDVFVQSSDDEGTSNALLEAMALEVPIVATAVGGTGELIEDGMHGLLVPPGDVTALAAALDKVLNDAESTARRCAAARKRVEQELSFSARMQAVEAIYEELMAERGRQPRKVGEHA